MNVVYFLLCDSPASEFYMPTFRNTLLVQMEQTACSEMPTHEIQIAGNRPKERIKQELSLLCDIVPMCLLYQLMIIFTIRQVQLNRSCIFGRYSILLTCFKCYQPSPGRTPVHKKSKIGDASPYK